MKKRILSMLLAIVMLVSILPTAVFAFDDHVAYTVGLASTSSTATYVVYIENGHGSGTYEAGETVTISANSPEAGKVFSSGHRKRTYSLRILMIPLLHLPCLPMMYTSQRFL